MSNEKASYKYAVEISVVVTGELLFAILALNVANLLGALYVALDGGRDGRKVEVWKKWLIVYGVLFVGLVFAGSVMGY